MNLKTIVNFCNKIVENKDNKKNNNKKNNIFYFIINDLSLNETFQRFNTLDLIDN